MFRLLSGVVTFWRESFIRQLLAAGLLVALLFTLTIGAPYAEHQLASWNMLPKPDATTELYFAHAQSLPNIYQPGVQQQVAIVIHNDEGHAMTYQYTVSQTDSSSNNSRQLATGSATIAAGKTQSIGIVMSPVDMGSRSKMIVSLQSPNEAISYWMMRSAK